MARSSIIVCRKCEQKKRVIVPSGKLPPSVCGDCQAKEAEKEEKEYLEGLKEMDLEERVENLEREIFRIKSTIKRLSRPRHSFPKF